jgi:hypothetical protein
MKHYIKLVSIILIIVLIYLFAYIVYDYIYNKLPNSEHFENKDDITTHFANNGINLKGGTSAKHNPNNNQTHFPWSGDNTNYIRGDTRVDGDLTIPGYVKTNSIGSIGKSQGPNDSDWLRIWGGENGIALVGNTAIAHGGGTSGDKFH